MMLASCTNSRGEGERSRVKGWIGGLSLGARVAVGAGVDCGAGWWSWRICSDCSLSKATKVSGTGWSESGVFPPPGPQQHSRLLAALATSLLALNVLPLLQS